MVQKYLLKLAKNVKRPKNKMPKAKAIPRTAMRRGELL